MARKTQYLSDEKGAEVSELLDALEHLIERTKVLYEQYFMGIQKTAPGQLHRDIERKIREVTQMQVRNTALRYRLNTLTQKFGVYNNYWRRVLREIEQGRYIRDVARASRRALSQGEDLPDEILMSIPKRIRERILEDREALAKRAELGEEHSGEQADELPGSQPEQVREPRKQVHTVGSDLFDDDIDALFDALTRDAEEAIQKSSAPQKQAPVSPPAPSRPSAKENVPKPPDIAETPAASIAEGRVPKATPPPPPSPGVSSGPRKPPPPPIPRPKEPPLPPGMSAAESRDLYMQYIKARKQVGASTNIPYERLMQTLNEQAPQVLKQHNAAAVEFRVEVKDDKVILKAKPKKP